MVDVTVYLPTILAVSAARLVLPRKKLGSFLTLYYIIAISLGLADIALGIIAYKELKVAGVYSPVIPAVLAVTGLTLTHKLYSFEYSPALFSTVSGFIAVELVYAYFAITNYVLLAAVFIVVAGIVYSIVSYVFAVLDFVTRLLDLLPFRLIIAGVAVAVAVAIAAGYPLPP